MANHERLRIAPPPPARPCSPARLDLLARYIDALLEEEVGDAFGAHASSASASALLLLWAANGVRPPQLLVPPLLRRLGARLIRGPRRTSEFADPAYEAIESQCAEGSDVPIGRALGKGEAEDEARAYWRRFI